MILKRRCQADDALGNQGRSFGKRMGGLDLRIGELIEPPRRARDHLFPDKARQRLRSDAFGHEILKPEHSAGFQEIESTCPLGACWRHRCVTTPLHS